MNHARGSPPLRVLCVNVRNGGPHNDAILALGSEGKYDVLLVQEPYAVWSGGRQMLKTHPFYKTYTPSVAWVSHETRPRVVTYVNKRLRADQLPILTSQHFVWVAVRGITLGNLYRKPRDNNIIESLSRWAPSGGSLVAGDFNAGHETWGGSRRNRGEDVASWAGDNGMSLLNTPGEPTHDEGGVLDLGFSNVPHAALRIAEDLETGSDHRTLEINIPTGARRTVPVRKHILGIMPEDEEAFLAAVKRRAEGLSLSVGGQEDLDLFTSSLSGVMTGALWEAGHVPNPQGNWAVWWNEECRVAHKNLVAARRRSQRNDPALVREFKRCVVRAKRELWRRKIDEANTERAIFAISRWANRTTANTEPPPLVSRGRVFSTEEEKAEELREVKLGRVGTGDDHPDGGAHTVPIRDIPFQTSVSIGEAYQACCTTGNTSPGADEVNVRMLRLAWPIVGEAVRLLYEKSLTLGYYPAPFRKAEVVMITKPGKTDLTSAKSYRPISLTSCIGKGVDRLLSWRMSHLTIQNSIMDPHQIGSLAKRSANDIACALTHDVEVALERGRVATLVTMDVEGAFDCVLRNRLVTRLREQGWPLCVTRLVDSFMTRRQCRMRMGDYVGEFRDLECGLPQGSPCSPLLFSLYTEPIYRLLNYGQRYGYADDAGLLVTGPTLEDTARLATQGVSELEEWGRSNAVTFDFGKTEAMHFTRRLSDKTEPPVLHGGRAVRHPPALRWLGVHFDKKLTFRAHVEEWVARGNRVAGHLRAISNTMHGPPPWLTRKATRACVEPVLYHGAEVWYPGLHMPARKDRRKMVGTGVTGMVHMIDKVVKTSARAILPVWRTTPLPVLHRESGLLPAGLMLEHIRRRHSARLQRLDEQHPIASRVGALNSAGSDQQRFRRPSRLQRAWELLPRAERPVLQRKGSPAASAKGTLTKEGEAARFLRWLRRLSPGHYLTYTDGSRLDSGAAGWGFSVRQSGLPDEDAIRRGCGRLDRAEVFDAEAIAALHGLRVTLGLRSDPSRRIYVLLDNQSAVGSFRGRLPESSQSVFRTFQELSGPGSNVYVRWVPGHVGVPGNEEADAMAKRGALQTQITNNTPTAAWVSRQSREITRASLRAWALENLPTLYQAAGLEFTSRGPEELRAPRGLLHHLLAARTGHGDYAEYHQRFNHEGATLECSCGKLKHRFHVFYCRKVPPNLRIRLGPRAMERIATTIGPKHFDKFIELIKEGKFFDKICPRRETSRESPHFQLTV